MAKLVLKEPQIPEQLEADMASLPATELQSFEATLRIIVMRSAIQGYRVLHDMYNIFKEYPELIGELFELRE